MIKIAFDALGLTKNKAGIGNFIHYFLLNLDKSNSEYFKFDVFINKDLIDLFDRQSNNITFYPLKIYSNYHRLFLQFTLRFFFKKKYDVLFSPDYPFTFFLKSKVKLVSIIPDLSIFKRKRDYTLSQYLPKRIGYSRTVKHADLILSYSLSVKNDLLKYFPDLDEKKVNPVWLGVSPQFSKKELISDEYCAKITQKYNLPPKYFLFVGTMMPRKNLKNILLAFNSAKERTNISLVIAGVKGWKFDEELGIINSNLLKKSVKLLGYVEDNALPSIYKMAEFLIFPSFDEGFGIPILEAFSVGTPVITSNLSSMKEIAGDAALLVDPTNVEEISSAIIKLSQDRNLRKEFALKGSKRVKLFDWGMTVKKTLIEIEKLI